VNEKSQEVLLPPLLNITSTEIRSSTYLYDPESNPSPILKSTLQQFALITITIFSICRLHERHEHDKFTGKHGRYNSLAFRGPILQEMLEQRYTVLPFTIDPVGQLGQLID
jgi:hypothetical protein